jgi:hypothetical protein
VLPDQSSDPDPGLERGQSPRPSDPAPQSRQHNPMVFSRAELVDALEDAMRRIQGVNIPQKKSPKTRKRAIDQTLEKEKEALDHNAHLQYMVSRYMQSGILNNSQSSSYTFESFSGTFSTLKKTRNLCCTSFPA